MSIQHAFMKALLFAMLASATVMAADNQHALTPADLLVPAQLNSQLALVKSGKIMLIHVGFRMMYEMAHIPNSQYTGAAAKEEGIAGLKKLVAGLPHNKPIVIYCGCCPWDHCPNIRPAFETLKQMGFSNVKALDIPQRFGDDWTAKGYPVASGD
jgi:thiosulfate/3-mercaptopyruvate sulfurtransferase